MPFDPDAFRREHQRWKDWRAARRKMGPATARHIHHCPTCESLYYHLTETCPLMAEDRLDLQCRPCREREEKEYLRERARADGAWDRYWASVGPVPPWV